MSIKQDKVDAIVKTEGKEERTSFFPHIVYYMCVCACPVCMSAFRAPSVSPEYTLTQCPAANA